MDLTAVAGGGVYTYGTPWAGHPTWQGLRIDPTKVGDAHLFRPWGWTMVLIVSEKLKQALEREGLTGTRFTEV